MAMLLLKCSVDVFVYNKGDTCPWENSYYGCDDSLVEAVDTFSVEGFGDDVAC